MSKELENIYDDLKKWAEEPLDEIDEQYGIWELNHKETKLIINYIINLQQENKQLKEEKPYLYTNTEWEDILEYQGKSYIELDRYKKREKEIMDKYFHQSKYASEMEDKYISANGILTELEEWLRKIIEWNKSILKEDAGISDLLGINFHREAYIKIWEDTLDKIQELKEKYK